MLVLLESGSLARPGFDRETYVRAVRAVNRVFRESIARRLRTRPALREKRSEGRRQSASDSPTEDESDGKARR
jgi:hypothetical protein